VLLQAVFIFLLHLHLASSKISSTPDGQFLMVLTAGSNSLTADPLVPSPFLDKNENCQTKKKIRGGK